MTGQKLASTNECPATSNTNSEHYPAFRHHMWCKVRLLQFAVAVRP
jgi:hypothetical protein